MSLRNAYYDNTKLSTYKGCPRQYYFRHLRHWRRQGTALPLVFGLSWHEAMDIVWGLVGQGKSDNDIHLLAVAKFVECWTGQGMKHPNDMDIEDIAKFEPRSPQIAAEMLWNYIQDRKEFITNSEIVAIEPPFAVPIYEYPDTGKKIFYIGRKDKIIRAKRDGRIYIIEHKTTAMVQGRAPDHQFKFDYIEQWSLNSQVDGYLQSGLTDYGNELKSIYIDAALVHKKTHDKFKFIPVERALQALDNWVDDALEWCFRVEKDTEKLNTIRDTVRAVGKDTSTSLNCFPKNTESCFGKYNNKCQYFDLCRYWGNPEQKDLPDGMIEEEWNPYALHEIDKLDLEN